MNDLSKLKREIINWLLYSHTLLVQMQNGIAVMEGSSVVSHKCRHNLIIWSRICALRYLQTELNAYVHTKSAHKCLYKLHS